MRPIHVTALLALSALALPTSTAFAQRGAANTTSNAGGVYRDDDVPMCQTSGGGTRTRANCTASETRTTWRVEQEFKIAIEMPLLLRRPCEVTASTEYQQRNTMARVNGTLEIPDCAAATGEFTVAVRVRDESGAIKSLEFTETWQRGDDQDVKFTADYPIGDNVELVGARLRGMRCKCVDSSAQC